MGTCLAGVNPVVQQNFTDAVAWPEPSGTAESFYDYCRGHAAALTRAASLVAEPANTTGSNTAG
jgi:hypothetical protein